MKEPLYITGFTIGGEKIIGGIFKMQDQKGFPIDASFEICRENGWVIDWAEALCDCWINDCLKFESFVRQAEMISKTDIETKWKNFAIIVLNHFPEMMKAESPILEACKYILNGKISNGISIT